MASNLEVGMKCIKYMLLSITAMFVLTSALIISVGTTIFAFYHDFSYFLEAHYFTPATLIIVIGVIMLFVSLFGCIGAFKESTCLVNIFAFILGLVLILEVAAAIAAYNLRHGMPELVDAKVRDSVELYTKDPEVEAAFDFIQSHLNCCGVDSYSDWGQLGSQLEGNGIYVNNLTVPDSCCAVSEYTVVGGLETTACVDIYANGCLPRLIYLVAQSAGLLGTGALTIALIQVIGIIFSLMLAKAIRRAKSERERRRWEIREQMINNYTKLNHNEYKPTPVVYVPTGRQTVA